MREDGFPIGTPRPVDVHVGSRLRLRRTLMGMSQEKLGEAVSLTFQQIQKYERGANRIGASRLYQLSLILDVPVSYFFEEMPDGIAARTPASSLSSPDGLSDLDQEPFQADPMAKRETLELVRAYYRITDPKVRKRLFELTKSVANSQNPQD
ncbi:MAG: helix-turn-helix domain-containing protein [Rhodospirillales bacterium]|nr:helix-turn-helix domain-containing protein [Rhodospirillales bacterium]